MTITPAEVKAQLDNNEEIRLIDVREPDEFAIARIENAELLPMRSVPAQLEALKHEQRRMVFFCHHGMRSLQVVEWLRRSGVTNTFSMEGGIERWSLEVDRSTPRY